MSDRHATILVFNGGDAVPLGTIDDIEPDAFVIAADSGIDHARAHGRTVDLAIGDFDSVTPEGLAWATDAGATIDRRSSEKDQTDFELALDEAVLRAPGRIVVVGGHGGRIDHFLANVAVLTSLSDRNIDDIADTRFEARMGSTVLHIVRGRLVLSGTEGDIVTLLPQRHSTVTTTGLRYPLRAEVLVPGRSRGVSNELVAADASVVVDGGAVLVVHVRAGGE